jgi:hypothetical protein
MGTLPMNALPMGTLPMNALPMGTLRSVVRAMRGIHDPFGPCPIAMGDLTIWTIHVQDSDTKGRPA